jgi:FAD:protein FMN transferase
LTSFPNAAWGWAVLVALAAAQPLPVARRSSDSASGPRASAAVARVTREAWAMGTRVRVQAEALERTDAVRASEAVLREVARVERLLSSWDAQSELGRVNAATPGLAVPVSAELGTLLAEAERWARRTGRAFDPAVGALVDAWGVRGKVKVPASGELAAALAASGQGALTLTDGRVTRSSPRAWIDSGGFGKGAALRSMAQIARDEGVDRMLVDLGGQLWAEARAGAPWPIDVAHPSGRERPVARLEVRGVSVATSGSSERPGHLLDPRTGRPAAAWGSVTVVNPDPLEADVLSTALYVMGPVEGLAWARAAGVAALFLEAGGAGLRATWSEAMDAWLVTTENNRSTTQG